MPDNKDEANAEQSDASIGTGSRLDRLEAKIDDIVARLPEPAPPKNGHRVADYLERGWGTRIVAALGVWAIALTIFAFWGEMVVRREERQARTEEAEFRRLAQIATAWEVLLTRAGGDIGKGNALNTLIAAGHEIQYTDLSCEAIGEFEDGVCVNPPQFNNVVLGDGDFWTGNANRLRCDGGFGGCYEPRYLAEVNLQGARISGLRAEGITLDKNFNGVEGEAWVARDVFATSSGVLGPSGFRCDQCEFYDSELAFGVIQSLEFPLFANSTVYVRESNRWSGGSYRFLTFLDSPVLFRKPLLSDAVQAAWEDPTVEFNPLDYVDLSLYENAHFCINEEDAHLLKSHLAERRDRAEAQLATERRQSTDQPQIVLVHSEEDLLFRELFEYRDFSQTYTLRTWDESAYPRREATTAQYYCGADLESVKPLLEQRISQHWALDRWG